MMKNKVCEYPKNLDKIICAINSKCYSHKDIEAMTSRLTDTDKKYIADFQESVNVLIREENLFIGFEDTKYALLKLIEQYKDNSGFLNSQLYVMLEQLISVIETEKDNDIKKSDAQGVLLNYLLMISAFVDNRL